jgi:hypothetical protein
MLGFDAAWDRRSSDADLADRAASQGRILLTRDRELLKRATVTHGYCVRSTEPGEQAVEIIRRFDLAGASKPLSRCLRCNLPLLPLSVPPDTVPPSVRESGVRFLSCPECRRTYWRGSHWRHMTRTIDRLLAAARPCS